MASITRISNNTALTAVNAIADLFDVGGAGRIDIMSGTQPADVDTAITDQVVLGSLTLNNPAFAAASDQGGYASASANTITTELSADATGTATWFRAYNGAGTAILDGNIGTENASLILNTVTITAGGVIHINPWHLRLYETE